MNDDIFYHNAVRKLNPSVVNMRGAEAFDSNNNSVSYDVSAAETEAKYGSLRQKRNQLLAETDYLALSDVTMSDKMQTYRQALRDLPANTSDPANPVWPTKPGD